MWRAKSHSLLLAWSDYFGHSTLDQRMEWWFWLAEFNESARPMMSMYGLSDGTDICSDLSQTTRLYLQLDTCRKKMACAWAMLRSSNAPELQVWHRAANVSSICASNDILESAVPLHRDRRFHCVLWSLLGLRVFMTRARSLFQLNADQHFYSFWRHWERSIDGLLCFLQSSAKT